MASVSGRSFPPAAPFTINSDTRDVEEDSIIGNTAKAEPPQASLHSLSQKELSSSLDLSRGRLEESLHKFFADLPVDVSSNDGQIEMYKNLKSDLKSELKRIFSSTTPQQELKTLEDTLTHYNANLKAFMRNSTVAGVADQTVWIAKIENIKEIKQQIEEVKYLLEQIETIDSKITMLSANPASSPVIPGVPVLPGAPRGQRIV